MVRSGEARDQLPDLSPLLQLACPSKCCLVSP
jgi:hypothetical protein